MKDSVDRGCSTVVRVILTSQKWGNILNKITILFIEHCSLLYYKASLKNRCQKRNRTTKVTATITRSKILERKTITSLMIIKVDKK